MDISLASGGTRRDICVVYEGEPSMGDLLAAAGLPPCAHVVVDGRLVDIDDAFSDACRPGSIVQTDGTADERGSTTVGSHAVHVVGGLAAGFTHPVGGRSEVVVGRSPQADIVVADPTVSPFHLRLRREGSEWFAQDLGSHNGTVIDGAQLRPGDAVGGRTVRIGATTILVGPLPAEIAHRRRPGEGGLTPFNRPPRSTPAPAREVIDVPDPPADRRRGATFSLAALTGPVVIGAVMVQVLGSTRYALFALLAPVMMITNAVATRRRNAKDAKSSARRFRRELGAFESALRGASIDEALRRDGALVDLATLLRRVEAGSVRLWERRAHHRDQLLLRLGTGRVPWAPPVDAQRVAAHPELQQLVVEYSRIGDAAVELSLADGGVIGLVGDRAAALAVARSLVVQSSALHGPSDLGVVVVAADRHAAAWDWTKWLPHTRAGAGRLLAGGAEASRELLGALAAALADEAQVARGAAVGAVRRPPLLLVVDGDELTTAHRAPAREFLRGDHGAVAGIVLAASAERLPSSCTVVVSLEDDLGAACVHDVAGDLVLADVVVDGLPLDRAEAAARSMAPFCDPDLRSVGGGLPSRCALLDVVDMHRDGRGRLDPTVVSERWLAAAAVDSLTVPFGVGPGGPVFVDLVVDGPHALVGGTTGAGKSEFLRSFVAGLAAGHSPEQVVFVLVDYKGGAAFDACARLPHVVGLVTDLDGHLAERALRSLEAELHHRERVLREVGAADIGEYRAAGAGEVLPRLVLVVDEFAAMAGELPEFMASLVGIAQRGRSLGVHMVLATQRPAGAVSADIKANTTIRVALRVQDDRDSIDVIDSADAAGIDRRSPGRGFVRLGPGEVVALQTPLSTGVTLPERAGVRLSPFRFGGTPPVERAVAHVHETDLEVLVGAAQAAHDQARFGAPRRPWLEMVTRVDLSEVVAAAGGRSIPVAIADDPDRQRRVAAFWDPSHGHLALLGAVGSGVSSALRSVALAALETAAEPVHVYAVDYGGELADLEVLHAVGAVIGGQDHERQGRLVTVLAEEVRRRRGDPGSMGERPQVLVLVDDLPAWLTDHGDASTQAVIEDIRRLFAEGPSVGVVVAFTADRAAAVPMRLWGGVTRRFLFRHADPGELTSTGLRRHELPEFIPGRAVDASTRLVVQFPDPPVVPIEASKSTSWPSPWRVDALPDAVPVEALESDATVDADATWFVPVGIDAARHATASLPLRAGDGALVAGPARSGVSTVLTTVARQVRRHVAGVIIVGIADHRSPLARHEDLFDAVGPLSSLQKVLEVAVLDHQRPWLVVMDDAHLHDEPGALEPLLAPGSHCRMVVGGRADHLHGSFGHWTRAVRRSSTGLLLNPRLETDGDLLGVRLPRHVPVPLHAGRGFLVADADASLVQFAA